MTGQAGTTVADQVDAEELGVNASEEEIGIIHVMSITFRRSVIVIVEDGEGVVGIGMSVCWPWRFFEKLVCEARARESAVRQLGVSRAKVWRPHPVNQAAE